MSNLHGCQHKKNGKIDLNDHVHVVLSKSSCCKAYNKKEGGWDKDCQQVVHNRTAHRDLSNNRFSFT